MINLASKETCTGCTACVNVCVYNAIEIVQDCNGFLYPIINENECVGCGLCEKRCPVLSPLSFDNAITPRAFALWSVPDRTVSSSGGAFSAFARKILDNGGIVFGAAFDEKLRCHHIKVDKLEELPPLRGSKYVQSELDGIFLEVKDCLKNGQQVLFTGTPCQIAGLYAYLHKDYDNLLTLDLACHGTPSNAVFQSYLSKLRSLKKCKISSFEFRRRNGWGYSPAISDRGKLIPIFDIENLYMCAFEKAALFRQSCYICPFAKLPRVGDCSIADFWGIGRHGKPFKHNVLRGVSLVLVNNARGMDAIMKLENVFREERTLEESLVENLNIIHPSPLHPQRNEIIQSFLNPHKSLKDISKEYHLLDNSLKGRIKKYASKYHLFDFAKIVYDKYRTL